MKKEAPENEASYLSHGLREAVFLFRAQHHAHFAPANHTAYIMFGRGQCGPEGGFGLAWVRVVHMVRSPRHCLSYFSTVGFRLIPT